MKRKAWLAVAFAAVIAVAGYCIARTPRYGALERQGDSIVQQIEQYRVAHGSYPASLADAGVKRPLTFFGFWYYVPVRPNSFELWVGEYGRDGFKLRYMPDRGWDLDT